MLTGTLLYGILVFRVINTIEDKSVLIMRGLWFQFGPKQNQNYIVAPQRRL